MLIKYSSWESCFNKAQHMSNKIQLLSSLENHVTKGNVLIDKKPETNHNNIVTVILKKNK